MRQRLRVLFFGISCFVVVGVSTLFGADVSFSARVNQTTINQDEELVLDVTISGEVDRSAQLKLPAFEGLFQVVSQSQQSSYSFVNGKSSSSQTKRLILVPIKTGTLVIPAASLVSNGTTYQTQPITIVVKKGSGAKSVRSSQQPQGGDLVFLSAGVSKQVAYVGEEIVFDLSFCRRTQLWSSISYQQPDFKGFWSENLKTKPDEYVKESEQGRYAVRELLSRSLFPLNPGTAVISEAKAGFVLNPFEGDRAIQSKPISITVKPLPLSGKPAYFSGLVGDFAMTISPLPSVVTQNQPVTIRLDVTGRGGLTRLSDLFFEESTQFKIYKSKTQDAIQYVGGVSGKRSFEYVVIPKVAGSLQFPTFVLSYFSPKTGTYKTLRLGGATVSVRPSLLRGEDSVNSLSRTGVALQEDIRYLHPVKGSNGVLYGLAWVLGVFTSLLLLAVSVLALLRQFVFKEDADVSFRLAYREVSSRLDRLEKKGHQKPYGELEHCLIDFLSSRTRTPLTGYSAEKLEGFLKEKGVSEPVIRDTMMFLESVQAAGYAPSGQSQDLQSLCEALRKLVATFKGEL